MTTAMRVFCFLVFQLGFGRLQDCLFFFIFPPLFFCFSPSPLILLGLELDMG